MTIDKKIEIVAEKLTNYISEKRIFDAEDIKNAIKINFKIALSDLMKNQISETEKEFNQYRYTLNSYFGKEREIRQKRLGELKELLKAERMTKNVFDQEKKLAELIKFLREKNENLLNEFFEHFEKIKN
jgi:uncharacterized protein (DUF3084 family)